MQQIKKYYKGVIVPMVSPIMENGTIDRVSSKQMINHLLNNGTVPFILGTTGECTLISMDQRDVLVKILIDNKRKNQPLIAGVNGLSFTETVSEANKYLKWGIDAVVITLPAYFKLSEKQIFNFFNDLSNEIKGNIILYNIPKTVNMSIPIQVIEELSHTANIIGIKDSEFNEKRLVLSLDLWGGRTDFLHFVGVNKLMIKGLKLGANGIIPSSANIQPELYKKVYEQCTQRQFSSAEMLFKKTDELSEIYQKDRLLGESLAALKSILSFKDLCQPFVLKPLTNLTEKQHNEIAKKFNHYLNPS